MIFVFNKWDDFCRRLKDRGIISIPACEVSDCKNYLVLKHDVENSPERALKLAETENKYGHKGTYYVQAYLLDDSENIEILKKIQKLGHEVSYHYDVMDSNKGNLTKAKEEFKKNVSLFEKNGFEIRTVCQHGNPVAERVGYTSNRDFFRNFSEEYPNIADIMVDYKEKYNTDYEYYSDAGRIFSLIYDPINNDVINSDEKNIPYNDLNELLNVLENNKNYIISTHPHRWSRSAAKYIINMWIFAIIKTVAKILMKIPFIKKIMSRYYYLAKKI